MGYKHIHKKIIQITLAQILIQRGFKHVSKKALNILTETIVYMFEIILKDLKQSSKYLSNTKNGSKTICNYLINKYFNINSFEYKELKSFCSMYLKINESINYDRGNQNKEILNSLNIIPKTIGKEGKAIISDPEKETDYINEKMDIDDIEFIKNKCNKDKIINQNALITDKLLDNNQNVDDITDLDNFEKNFYDIKINLKDPIYENSILKNSMDISYESFIKKRENLSKTAVNDPYSTNISLFDIFKTPEN